MRNTILLLTIILTACGAGRPVQSEIREQQKHAGIVAVACVEQLSTCEDWTPIPTEKTQHPRTPEKCSSDYAHACQERNREVAQYNRALRETPSHRSLCQQRVDSCVALVRALVGTPEKTVIHNHARLPR